MIILLPVDSRVADTQGFVVLDTDNGKIVGYETEESLPYNRKGFRGGVLLGNLLYVCNSFSVKIYSVEGARLESFKFTLVNQIQRPEWLIGRGANADLHMLYCDKSQGRVLLANSYMDCVDALSMEGNLHSRHFLWQISDEVRAMVPSRSLNAADLCHLNHIGELDERLLFTLGNLNGTQEGAIFDWERGEIVIRGLSRPHDGVYDNGQFFVTETGKCQLTVWDDISHIAQIKTTIPRTVDLCQELDASKPKHWVRGVLATKEYIFVAASQFQDREHDVLDVLPSHIIVIERTSLKIVDRLWIPSIGALQRPVLYSLLLYPAPHVHGNTDPE